MARVLQATPKLAELFDMPLRTASTGVTLNPGACAQWLLESASMEAAVQQLEVLALERRITVRHYWPIYGMAVTSDADLGHGFRILRIDTEFLHERAKLRDAGVPWRDRFPGHSTVLAKDVELTFHLPVSNRPTREEANKFWSEIELARQASVGLLLLASDSLVWAGGNWTACLKPDATSPNGGGFGLIGHIPFQAAEFPKPLDEDQLADARKLFDQYHQLPLRSRRVFARSMGAFTRALGALDSYEDTLLVVVALEALLMEGEPLESISRTMALRGAWLLGKDPGERAQIFSQIKQVYKVRSDLAHAAGVAWNADGERQGYEARHLYKRVARKVLEYGYPDWDALVLGGAGWKHAESPPAPAG
ncbi:MAG: hypothetical protein EOO73_36410 [Myxococcales bacterium]|nr:MAG: hypothetical protein EOO73_36410 [Myxococcales bacterium]